MKLTIKLDDLQVSTEVTFDEDDDGLYIEHYKCLNHFHSREWYAFEEATEREIDAAVWAAHKAAVDESKEP